MRTVDVSRVLRNNNTDDTRLLMTHEQFAREKNYRAAVAVARSMFTQGLITVPEMKRIERFFARKFSPV